MAVALAAALSVGLLVVSGTVTLVDTLRRDNQPENFDLSFYVLVSGTLLGILSSAHAAWRLLAPLGSVYRRGALSVVTAFATVLLMLVCIPVHQLFGRTGLLLLLAGSAVLAVVLSRYAQRWGTLP